MRRVRLARRKASRRATRAASFSRSAAPSGSKMRSSRPGRSSRRSIAAWKPSRVSKLSYMASVIAFLSCVVHVPCAAPFCDQAGERRKERLVGLAPVGELAQQPGMTHRERFPVDKEALAVVEERGLRIQPQRRAAALLRAEHHVRLG